MKRLSYEAKPINGIPNITEDQIQEILSQNPMRVMTNRKPIEKDILIGALETLKVDYAAHTGRDKKPPGVVMGPPCPHCQNEFFLQTGVCLTCINCSESSSCG